MYDRLLAFQNRQLRVGTRYEVRLSTNKNYILEFFDETREQFSIIGV
jgi:hypothetical protein